MEKFNRDICIVRYIEDIEKVSNIIKKLKGQNFIRELEGFFSMYNQYAFSVDSGMIICALLNNELSISPIIIKDHYSIEEYGIGKNDMGYKVFVYDIKTNEILTAQDFNDNIFVTGNIIYDSLIN